ncbi:MAG TPA: excisionase family DNA-binding protein [Kofleriaceae bacterium]|nr:excisionase family DNA-binding protein [Kofleriaceae bacterium]
MGTEADDDVITVVEAAKLLKVGKNALYDAIKRGEIPHLRVGKHIRLSRQAVMRALGSCGPQVAKKGQ